MAVKHILKKRSLAPKKRFGQNFLVHRHTAERIIALAGVTQQDTVMEIGVGLGALTIPLAARAKRVIGLEIDAGIIRYHQKQQTLPSNVELIHQDVLKADLRAMAALDGDTLKIIANLPYSISTPLLFRLIDHHDIMAWAVLMLQKEVGKRLTAKPGSKDYGIMSVQLATCAKVTTLMELGPAQFHPRPKVDSLVQRLEFQVDLPTLGTVPNYDRTLFKALVRAAFQQRRKTLLNALTTAPLLPYDKQRIEHALAQEKIPANTRAEQLSVPQFIGLTNAVAALKQQS